jgi:hypothetical protein
MERVAYFRLPLKSFATRITLLGISLPQVKSGEENS